MCERPSCHNSVPRPWGSSGHICNPVHEGHLPYAQPYYGPDEKCISFAEHDIRLLTISLNHGTCVVTPRCGHSNSGVSSGHVIPVSKGCIIGVAGLHVRMEHITIKCTTYSCDTLNSMNWMLRWPSLPP